MLLSKLQTKQELMRDYKELLPAMPADQWRRIRGEQDIIVRYEPERALAALPKLLANAADRERLAELVRRLMADERVQRAKPSTEQVAMVRSIGEALAAKPRASVRKTGARAARPGAKAPRRRAATRKG